MSMGRVCEIDEANNTSTVKYIISENNDTLVSGAISNLNETYCKIPFISHETIHAHHISQSDWEKYSGGTVFNAMEKCTKDTISGIKLSDSGLEQKFQVESDHKVWEKVRDDDE